MKKLIAVLIAALMLLFSCKEKEPTSPNEQTQSGPLSEATIGPTGGIIENKDFSLIIPEGAFASGTTLSLFLEDNDNSFASNRISNTYKIIGLPKNFSKPLTIKIRSSGSLVNEAFIAVGTEKYIEEREKNNLVYNLSAAADSLGFLYSTIQPFEIQSSTVQGKSYKKNENSVEVFILGLAKMTTYTSLYSQIIYNSELDRSKIENFGSYFDEGVNFYNSMKLISKDQFSSGTGNKIKIFIMSDDNSNSTVDFIEPDIGMLKSLDAFGDRFREIISHYKINLNESYYSGSDDNALKLIGYMGAFRFVRCYWMGNNKDWFDWATIFWTAQMFNEDMFTNGPAIMQPFYGMVAGQQKITTGFDKFMNYSLPVVGHGLGMSSFIKFIMDNYNENNELLLSIFSSIVFGSTANPVDAILNSINTEEFYWWPNFFKEYLLGNVYKVNINDILDKIPSLDELHFVDATDTLKYFEGSYPDFSAKLCRINISEAVKEKAVLNFKIGPSSLNLNYVTAIIFGLKDGQLTLLNEGTNFSVSEIQQYSTLIACIVNSGNEPPYTGNLNINLEVRTNSSDWKWHYVNIVIRDIQADVEIYSPYYNSYDTIFASNLTLGHQPYKVGNNGNVFSGIKDSIYDWGSHEIGNVAISLDNSSLDVLSFELSDSSIYNNDLYIDTWKLEGFNIPFYWKSETSLQQQISTNVSAHIANLEWYKIENIGLSNERRYKLLKIVGDNKASIEIYWYNNPP
jgi:hypothetical protein